MRKITSALILLALLTGCQIAGVKGFWNTHGINYNDIDAARDQFVGFAELAVHSPEEEALEAIDVLFDKLQNDTLAYYIYSEWIDGAFYNIFSPCRSAALYSKAVDRMVADGILTGSDLRPRLQKREWIQYNSVGMAATVPGTVIGEHTLVLVLDTGCPSCREALTSLADRPEWANVRRIAVCCGYGQTPEVPGWEYLTPENASAVFDVRMTPVYFVVAADGTVETTYQLAL